MSTREEFRDRVQGFLTNLTNRGYIPSGEQATQKEELDHLSTFIHIHLEVEALLEKAPVNPPELQQIAKQIRELPMVREIVADWPYVGRPDGTLCQRDLPVLETKLQEMLEYLASSKTAETNTEKAPGGGTFPTRRASRKPRANRPRHRKNLSPSERRAANVAKFIEELNRLRPGMTGASSDYEALRNENPHFRTFKVCSKFPELKEKVLHLQGHRRHIRLAQELAAADEGVKPATIQKDWKKHKPDKYRQHVYK